MKTDIKEVPATKYASLFYDGRNFLGTVMCRTINGQKVWETTPHNNGTCFPDAFCAKTRELAINMLLEPRTERTPAQQQKHTTTCVLTRHRR